MEIYNDDIVGIYSRCNRYLTEIVKASSANVSDVSPADMTRVESYLSNIAEHVGWVVATPHLDLPETHPLPRTLDSAPEIPPLENLHLEDLARLLVRGRDELINSQSARNATGLIPFDEGRFIAVITKANSLVAHIKDVVPVDYPESSPKTPDTGTGRTGIHPTP